MGYYWHLSPDPMMPIWANNRVKPCIKEIEKIIEKASEDVGYSSEQFTLDMSDQRLEFMINMWEQTKKLVIAKHAELLVEAHRRRESENGLPD